MINSSLRGSRRAFMLESSFTDLEFLISPEDRAAVREEGIMIIDRHDQGRVVAPPGVRL
jgi:hypothetical protein